MIAEWATSDDRGVSVLAAPGGVPLEVRIEPSALHQRPDVLARIVLDTAALAGQRAARRLRAELTATVGPEAARTLDRVGLAVPDEPDPDDEGFDGLGMSGRGMSGFGELGGFGESGGFGGSQR